MTIKSFFLSLAALLASTVIASARENVAAWEFTKATTYSGSWTRESSVASTRGDGLIAFEGASAVLEYDKSGSPTVGGVQEGDCFIFSLPYAGTLPKGADIDFAVAISAAAEGCASRWACEYFDGKKWTGTEEIEIRKYAIPNETTYVKTFTLAKPLKTNLVKVRLRSLETASDPKAKLYFMQTPRYGAYLAVWPYGAKENSRILILGNSKIYAGSPYLALLEIAHSQGRRLDMAINVKGGAYFAQHLKMERSQKALQDGDYEIVYLQNNGNGMVAYARDPEKNAHIKADAVALASKARTHSPACRLILEKSMAYPRKNWNSLGSAEAFNECFRIASGDIASAIGAEISPIGEAFDAARAAGLSVYWRDNAHQNMLGGYLKACVNYLLFFRTKFESGVSDCGLDPDQARQCRQIAEKVVSQQVKIEGPEDVVMAGERVSTKPVIARWAFSSETKKSGTWTERHMVAADGATLEFQGKAARFGYNKSGSVTVSGVQEGDCFILTANTGCGLKKGADIDVAVYMGIDREGGPAKWKCEYFDGRKWCGTGEEVSFTLKKYKSVNETSYVKTFTLPKKLGNKYSGQVEVRLRCLETAADPEANVYFMHNPRVGAYLAVWPDGASKTTRVLMLGNSFTFFGSASLALLEIAHSQGRRLDVGINVKGGQNFGQHLMLERSQQAVAAGGYEVALLQNQSQASSFYATDPVKYAYLMDDAKTLASEVRKYSPSCRLILERTWASPKENWRGFGSAEAFDEALQKGTEQLAPAMGADISPIGNAFILGRELGLPLYWTDDFHQNYLGAYLKACVNYLVLFGEPFTGEVSNWGQDPGQAKLCRMIAEKVVLGK